MSHCSRIIGRTTYRRSPSIVSQCSHVTKTRPRSIQCDYNTKCISASTQLRALRAFSSTPAVTAKKRKDTSNDVLVQYTTQKGKIWLPDSEKWIRPWTPEDIVTFVSGWTRGEPLTLFCKRTNNNEIDLDELAFYKKLVVQLCRQRDPSLPYDNDKFNWGPAYPDHRGSDQTEERRRLLNNKIKRRFRSIYDELLNCYPHPDWVSGLQKKTPNQWIDSIVELLSDPVREILASPYPPTIAKLKGLQWVKVDEHMDNARVELGVYGLVERLSQTPTFKSRDATLYVGSAASHRGGLVMRLIGHYFAAHKKVKKGSKPNFIQDAALNLTIPKFPFILLRLPNPTGTPDPAKTQENQQLLVLAEALFMVYLGAMSKGFGGKNHPLASASPWDLEEMPYRGVSGANPLWEAYGAAKKEEHGHEHERRLFAYPEEWPGWPTENQRSLKSQKQSDDEAIAAILAAAGIKAYPRSRGSRLSSQREDSAGSKGS